MIEIIKAVLQEISSTNPNFQSEAAREMIARLITAALESKDDLGVDEYPYTSDFGKKEIDEEEQKATAEEYSDEVYNGHRDTLSEEIASNTITNSSLGYIFESPDGGETVYKRKVGESEREVVTKEDWKQYNRNR